MSKAEELYNQKRYVFSLDEAIEHYQLCLWLRELQERRQNEEEKGI